MLTVRVVKSKWFRGKKEGSMLLTRDNKMCCIGFLARRLGARPKDIRGVATLEGTSHTKCLDFDAGTLSLGNAYETNDDEKIDDTERIQKLRVLGRKMGVKFVFVEK